jgi:hypothetical protein
VTTSPEAFLARHAEAQFGVFSGAQIRAVGLSADWRRNRLADGRLVAVHESAYRFAGTPLDWRGGVLAAVWAGGSRGRASHRSAARLWGIACLDIEAIELTCARWRRARHDGLVVHETKAFHVADHTMLDGIPVTTCGRTLLDLGAVQRPWVVETALDNALRRDLTTITDLQAMLRRLGKRGRSGAGVLRRIVETRSPGAPAESRQERRMARMLVRNGLPEPVLQYEVRDGTAFVARVDAAYPRWRIAVEYESYEHHTGRVALVRDNDRRHRLRRAGWDCIGVTAVDLASGGLSVCRSIRAIIEERSRSGVTDA